MKRLLLIIAIFIFIVGCSSADQDEANVKGDLKPVTFVLDWTPNTNHTGIYVAKSLGYFEEEGLDVDIIFPGEAGANQLIATGNADFGISYQEGLMLARQAELPLVSITAIMQHNTAGYASPVEKGITSPADLEDKTFGMNMSDLSRAIMSTAMEENGADFSTVKATNIGDSDFFVAIKRDIDFSLVFQGWTGIEAEIRGQELNMMYLKDLSDALDFYTPIIATNESLIENDPELVEKFIHAAVKGYEYAIEQPEEAAQILIDSVPNINEELVMRSQQWISTQYQDDASQFGIQDAARWQKVTDFMIEHELVSEDFDIHQAFTNDFLPER